MTACMICASDALRGLPMTDKGLLVRVARDMIQGARTGALAAIKPRRPGVCVVERCARLIEEACGGCARCQRCAIAAELRAAEDRINAERDTELAELEQAGDALNRVVDHFVEGLCSSHTPFGAVLIEECYGRKLLASPTGTT